jgi:pilus assembly protein CpaC
MLLLMACPSSLLFADDIIVIEKTEINSLNIDLGKSVVLKSKVPISRISVADTEVVEYLTLSTREIYLTAKKPGTTRLTLWVKGGMLSYDLEVTYDISTLKQKIREILPEEDGIRVISIGNTISLSGSVSSTAALSQVLTIAYSFVEKEGESNVQNLLEVNSSQQVMLEVRIAEMSKQLVRELGANFSFFRRSGDFGIGVLSDFGGLSSIDGLGSISAVLRRGKSTWTGVIDALEMEGLVRVLAQPTLIALSGQNASFLAGGEFPIPSDAGLGSTDIEWKPFGVGLSFKPIVLSKDRINIHVMPEVSELDYDKGIRTEDGLIIPGLNVRKVSTMVELADGQSFAIAGLMKNTVRDTVSKYPFLGDIPIIGLLFRKKEFLNQETELVIIITPHLVKPLESSKQLLPTDSYHEPDDIDFYLWGLSEARKKQSQPVKMSESLDGEFGHAIP